MERRDVGKFLLQRFCAAAISALFLMVLPWVQLSVLDYLALFCQVTFLMAFLEAVATSALLILFPGRVKPEDRAREAASVQIDVVLAFAGLAAYLALKPALLYALLLPAGAAN